MENNLNKKYRNEKKYYIIRPDGSSVFSLPYPEDFCAHCLILLMDREDTRQYRLVSFDKEMLVLTNKAKRYIIPKSLKATANG